MGKIEIILISIILFIIAYFYSGCNSNEDCFLDGIEFTIKQDIDTAYINSGNEKIVTFTLQMWQNVKYGPLLSNYKVTEDNRILVNEAIEDTLSSVIKIFKYIIPDTISSNKTILLNFEVENDCPWSAQKSAEIVVAVDTLSMQ
jgi:hypothetical protein